MLFEYFTFNYESIALNCNLKIIINQNGEVCSLEFMKPVFQQTKTKFPQKVENTRIQCQREFSEYFVKKRKSFNIPYILEGTEFQKMVWNAISNIPYGKTLSYKDIAESIKCFRAFQAVGTAVGKNPLPILLPCHRVIKANGDWGQYSGGVSYKKTLLQLENVD